MWILGVLVVLFGILLYAAEAKVEPPVDPDLLVAPLGIPMETKTIEQLGVTVEVPATAWVKDQIAKAALTGDISGGMSEEVFEEYFQKPYCEAIGITVTDIPTLQRIAEEVNLKLGGSYVNGILTPPLGWTGTVTDWSRYVQKVALQTFDEQKAPSLPSEPKPVTREEKAIEEPKIEPPPLLTKLPTVWERIYG